jgi:hypothetical protein
MNIDERLERLAERHEALPQSVEILPATVHEQSGNIDQSEGVRWVNGKPNLPEPMAAAWIR